MACDTAHARRMQQMVLCWRRLALHCRRARHLATRCQRLQGLRPSVVKKNGDPTRRATQTQLCPSFSMLPWQLPSWTGPKKVGTIENRGSRCLCVACCNGKLQRFPFFCSIENTDGRCVCVACCDGKLQRFPFFFTIDELQKTPQSLKIGTVSLKSVGYSHRMRI